MTELVGKHYVLLKADKRAGGLSTVRKGIDTRDGSPVAVKIVAGSSDELSRKVFERETRSLRSLSHPNIVGLRDAGVTDAGSYYLVLDWVERNLNDLLKDPPWQGWDELYESLVEPLLSGLSYAHLKQLEHRDIKPSNILVDASGAPLLADFGIAKIRGDEPQHSELTVQQFRSAPYAPPELDAPVPYVRDVYSVGVVLLQCLSDSRIRDFPDIKQALESARLPPDVRTLIESCVSLEPTDRPANGSILAAEFKKVARQQLARAQQPRNPLWLDLTRAAQTHLGGEPADRDRAAARLQEDLSGEVFAEFGSDRERLRRDRNMIILFGSEHRYTLKLDDSSPRMTVTAAPALELDILEGGRRHGMALPPIFSWVVRQPTKLDASERAKHTLVEMLEDFYQQKDRPDVEPSEQGDEIFDLWLRVLDAREELARGSHQPLSYKKWSAEGRRSTFTLTEACEIDLVGMDWEVVDQQSGKRFGHGEVIDQEADRLVLLARRPLAGLPARATLRPYDAPSTIAINRQRNAVTAIRNGTTPGPNLRAVLMDPGSNEEPAAEEDIDWSAELDEAKKGAVQLALGSPELLVVQGPPGTGKTRFITEIVIQTLKRQPHARILIASQTHVAVDNAVERLHAAGVQGLVRLAGADDSTVQPSVRELLLDRQVRRWTEHIRSRAGSNIARRAKALGIESNHLAAALTLQEIVAVSEQFERAQEHVANLIATGTDRSDLLTALDDEDPADRFQARLEQLSDRRRDLAAMVQRQLAGDLTIPNQIGSVDARSAIQALIGDSRDAQELLKQLELQAAWLERISAEESLAAIYLSGTSVVAGTCTGFLRYKAAGQLEFDLCIVDEASKATPTEVLVPMSRAKRWILVGDTRQLPPTDEDLLRATELLAEHGLTRDDITENLFQRMVDHLPAHSQVMLEEQYRMVRPIGDLVSTCFYEGRLRSPRTEGLAGYDRVMGGTVTWIDTGPLGDKRYEQGTTSFANRAEAQVVLAELDRIERAIGAGFIKFSENRKLEVLVIAPYKSQVEDLRRRLAPRTFKHVLITAMSVDAVQGRESDLAIVSLTRSNPQGRLGFLGADYWRRINVAMSRARFGLTIVGDASFIRGTNGALKTVLEYIEQHRGDCEIRLAE